MSIEKKNSCYNSFGGVKFWRDHQSCNIKLSKEIKLSFNQFLMFIFYP